MHHIHRTKSFVIGSVPFSEADKQLILLTQDLGVVRAVAQGSRKNESKMRQSIQDYSLVDAALVSGRTGWRLVNVAFVENFYNEIEYHDLRDAVCRVIALINRLVAGEVPDPHVFDLVSIFVNFAKSDQKSIVDKNLINTFETLFNARVLNILGYLDSSPFEKYVFTELTIGLLDELSSDETMIDGDSVEIALIKEINKGIQDSSL